MCKRSAHMAMFKPDGKRIQPFEPVFLSDATHFSRDHRCTGDQTCVTPLSRMEAEPGIRVEYNIFQCVRVLLSWMHVESSTLASYRQRTSLARPPPLPSPPQLLPTMFRKNGTGGCRESTVSVNSATELLAHWVLQDRSAGAQAGKNVQYRRLHCVTPVLTYPSAQRE